jgi:2,6-dihydroxypseudooxynicotine hydrolase
MQKASEVFKRESIKMGEQVFDHWLPRFLVSGADFNDVNRIRKASHEWEKWPYLWEENAKKNITLAFEAEMNGNLITAGNAYRRASLYYQYAQFMLFDRPQLKIDLHQCSIDFYEKAIKFLNYPGEKLYIPFKGKSISAYHRKAKMNEGRIVLFIPGADATKEEMSTFEEIFIERGVSTLTIDGPGQGETQKDFPFRKDTFDESITVVLNYICNEMHYSEIAVGGISYGGHLAPRAAACNPIIKAAFGIGGRYDFSEWGKGTVITHADFSWVFGVDTFDEAEALRGEVDLSDVISNLKCPLLIIHGDQDKIVNVGNSTKIIENSNSIDPNLIIIKGGNHVCNNYPYIYRPLVGDWIVEKLG